MRFARRDARCSTASRTAPTSTSCTATHFVAGERGDVLARTPLRRRVRRRRCARGNVFGTQFHPEKSSRAGLAAAAQLPRQCGRMLKVRVIPTLLWKDFGLVKGVGFDSWRRVGPVLPAIKVYNTRDVDELVLLDITATRSGRGPDLGIDRRVRATSASCRSRSAAASDSSRQIATLLRAGADKVSVNTAAYSTSRAGRGRQRAVSARSAWWPASTRCAKTARMLLRSQRATRLQDRPGAVGARARTRGAGEILLTSDRARRHACKATTSSWWREWRRARVDPGDRLGRRRQLSAHGGSVQQAGASRGRGGEHVPLHRADAARGQEIPRCERHSGAGGKPLRRT